MSCTYFKGSVWSGRLIQKGWNILSYVIFLPPSIHYRCTSVLHSTFALYFIEKQPQIKQQFIMLLLKRIDFKVFGARRLSDKYQKYNLAQRLGLYLAAMLQTRKRINQDTLEMQVFEQKRKMWFSQGRFKSFHILSLLLNQYLIGNTTDLHSKYYTCLCIRQLSCQENILLLFLLLALSFFLQIALIQKPVTLANLWRTIKTPAKVFQNPATGNLPKERTKS